MERIQGTEGVGLLPAQARIQWGGGGMGGVLSPFGGPPNFIKREKNRCALARENAAF